MEAVYRNILSKLLKTRVLTEQSIVEGSLILGTGRQRNRFFYVKSLKGQSFFLKQPSGEPNAQNSLLREAMFYQFLSNRIELSDLSKISPALILFDPDDSLLVLEMNNNSRSLNLVCSNGKHYKHPLLTMFGACAARIHSTSTGHFLDKNIQFDLDGLPHWITRLQETPSPLRSLRTRSVASSLLVDELLADARIMQALSQQLDQWRVTHLIHGDYKWENAIVLNNHEQSLCIIDWENVNLGDPAWDVGYGFASILVNEVLTSRIAPIKLDSPAIIAAMQSFWTGYVGQLSRNKEEMKHFLRRAIYMMATRLLIVAFELCYAEDEVPTLAHGIVQISQMIYGGDAEQIASAIEQY